MELDGPPSTVIRRPAVTPTFDLLTRKLNKYFSRPRYIWRMILVQLAAVVTKTLH